MRSGIAALVASLITLPTLLQSPASAQGSDGTTSYIQPCPETDPFVDRLNAAPKAGPNNASGSMTNAKARSALADVLESCRKRTLQRTDLSSQDRDRIAPIISAMAGSLHNQSATIYAALADATSGSDAMHDYFVDNVTSQACAAFADFGYEQRTDQDQATLQNSSQQLRALTAMVHAVAPARAASVEACRLGHPSKK